MERRAGRSMHRAMAVVAIVSMAAPLGGCSTLKGWGFGNGAALGAVGGGVAGLATTIAVRPSSDGGQTAIVLGAAIGGVLLGGEVLGGRRGRPVKEDERRPGAGHVVGDVEPVGEHRWHP